MANVSKHCDSISVPSDPRSLASLREWIGSLDGRFGRRLDKKAKGDLMIALVEAVDNAIFHAHNCDRSKHIDISLRVDDGEAELKVGDCGKGIGRISPKFVSFDDDHGRGLYIIKKLMTKVESVKENGRHVLVMKYNLGNRSCL